MWQSGAPKSERVPKYEEGKGEPVGREDKTVMLVMEERGERRERDWQGDLQNLLYISSRLALGLVTNGSRVQCLSMTGVSIVAYPIEPTLTQPPCLLSLLWRAMARGVTCRGGYSDISTMTPRPMRAETGAPGAAAGFWGMLVRRCRLSDVLFRVPTPEVDGNNMEWPWDDPPPAQGASQVGTGCRFG